MADALQEHLVAAGFHDHRVVHHTVMAHVTYDGIRTTELAERAGVTKQAMSELVRDLVALGYLRTKPDPNDGRAKLVTFSARGRRAVEVAMSVFEMMDEALVDEVGPTAVHGLRRSLLALVATSLAPGTIPPRRRADPTDDGDPEGRPA